MNRIRRKEIDKCLEELSLLQERIQCVLDEEEECFDNLPENLQDSERGETMQSGIDYLNDCISNLEEATENLEYSKGE